MVYINIESSNGDVFLVNADIAKRFAPIKAALDTWPEYENDCEPLLIPYVNSAILKKVLEWVSYHKNDPPLSEFVINGVRRTDDISAWDYAFLNVDRETLAELANAANYLGINGLFDVACKTIANMIKGKSREQLRELR